MKFIIFDWGRTLYDPEKGELFPDTRPTLEYLKSEGHTLSIVALATAGQAKIDERMQIIEEEKLFPYFATVKFDVADKDRMYEDTLRELDIASADTAIVDDRVIRGIKWGNQHGCQTIWVKNGKFKDELPDEETGNPTHIITSVGELRAIL